MELHPDTLTFLAALKNNNNRDWFAEQKPRHQLIQTQLTEFTERLLLGLVPYDERMLDIAAKKCVFRIHKDARFAKGEPYKTHIGVHLVTSNNRSDWGRAGFYIHIEPGASMIAGGAYHPTAEWLNAIRGNIDERGDELKKILANPVFKKTFGDLRGEQLLKPPRGYTKDHPYIALLKYKTLTVSKSIPDSLVMSGEFFAHCIEIFKVYQPFRDFLNRPIPNNI